MLLFLPLSGLVLNFVSVQCFIVSNKENIDSVLS